MLRDAKDQCERLVVAIQTDPTIDRRKKNKPIQSLFERITQVAACKYVDQVVVYETEEDLLNILKTQPINVRILGSDYEQHLELITGNEVCADKGVELYFHHRDPEFSSSELRKRIKNAKD